jgi:hypothetical protein
MDHASLLFLIQVPELKKGRTGLLPTVDWPG